MPLRGAVLLLTFAISAVAAAATVEIRQEVAGSEASLYLRNSLDVGVSGLALLVGGATGFSVDVTNPDISGSDSGFFDEYPYVSLLVNAVFGHDLALAHSSEVFLGTLQLDPGVQFIDLEPGDPLFGYSLLDVNGNPIVYESFYTVHTVPCDTCPRVLGFTVPEPAGVPDLVSLAVAALGIGAALARGPRSGIRLA
jgi:hypothetical protein